MTHKEAFNALVSGKCNNCALMECTVNGQPATVIVAVNREGERIKLYPMFVSITPDMDLLDAHGYPPTDSVKYLN